MSDDRPIVPVQLKRVTPICAIGASAGGVAAAAELLPAGARRSRPRLCGDRPSGARPSERDERDPVDLHLDAGAPGDRRAAAAAELRLRHPARPRTGDRRRQRHGPPVHRAAGAAGADRHVLPLDRGRPRRRPGGGADRRRLGRRARRSRDQGGGRRRLRAGAGRGRVPLHAAERHRHRRRRFRRRRSPGWWSGSPRWRAARRRCARSTSTAPPTICGASSPSCGHGPATTSPATSARRCMRRVAAAHAGLPRDEPRRNMPNICERRRKRRRSCSATC